MHKGELRASFMVESKEEALLMDLCSFVSSLKSLAQKSQRADEMCCVRRHKLCRKSWTGAWSGRSGMNLSTTPGQITGTYTTS